MSLESSIEYFIFHAHLVGQRKVQFYKEKAVIVCLRSWINLTATRYCSDERVSALQYTYLYKRDNTNYC